MLKQEFYNVPEFANEVGKTEAAIYAEVRKGRIKAAKMGKFVLIPTTELEKYRNTLVQKYTPQKATIVPKVVQEELQFQMTGNARVCQLIEIIRFKLGELEVELKRIA